MRYQNHFDSTGQRDRSRWERELHSFVVVFIIIIIIIIIINIIINILLILLIILLLLLLLLIIIIIILYFSLMRSVFRRWVSGNLSLEVSALRQWLPIRAHKLFHRCVLCSNFRVTLFDFIILFCVLAFTVFILWERYLDREVRKTILVRHIHVCISIT